MFNKIVTASAIALLAIVSFTVLSISISAFATSVAVSEVLSGVIPEIAIISTIIDFVIPSEVTVYDNYPEIKVVAEEFPDL